MNHIVSWRKKVLSEPGVAVYQGNYGLQGSASDYRGRVQNLASPVVKYDRNPWVPQYDILEPFTNPQRVPNPSPGVRQLQPQRGHGPTVGPLIFSPAGTASINFKGF